MKRQQSLTPSVFAAAGLGLVVAGAFLPWMHLFETRALNGFDGGWIGAWTRGHFTDDARIPPSRVAMGCRCMAHARSGDRRPRIVLIMWHAEDHLIAFDRGGGVQDTTGVGLWLTLGGGLLTSLGALLGNTPEFLFGDADGRAIAGDRG